MSTMLRRLLELLPKAPPFVTSLTFVDSATGNGSTIVVPATAQAGDIAFLVDAGRGNPPEVIPSGWSLVASTSDGNTRVTVTRKVLVGGDVGATITGMNPGFPVGKVMLVFRPNATIVSVTPSTWNTPAPVSGDPPSQNVAASGGTPPLIVFGTASSSGASAFSTQSPAFDEVVSNSGVGLGVVAFGYKIYNSSPVNHTIDMGNTGGANTLQSGYVALA